ncbi:MAG: hypothetical protein Tsb002_23330 [Wenzhouxiangellaceae bacterium]
MKKLIFSLLTVCLLAIAAAPVSAQTIYDCANAGGTDCKDTKIGTAQPENPNITNDTQCKLMCISLASSIQRSLGASNGTGWVCVATASSFSHYTEDPHGRTITHCECDVHCLKSISVDADAVPIGEPEPQ